MQFVWIGWSKCLGRLYEFSKLDSRCGFLKVDNMDMAKLVFTSFGCATIFALMLGCQGLSKEGFFHGSLGITQKIILASSAATTTSPYHIVQYSIDGVFEKVLYDSTFDNRTPRAMAMIDPFSFLIATDTVDGILLFDYLSGVNDWVTNSNFNGVIGEMVRASNGDVFAIEGTTIESFDANGLRIGNPRIAATIGSCAMTTAVRGMAINASGYLVVGSQGNDDILFYNISNPASTTCVTANNTLGNVDPVAIVAHSDGYVYVAHSGGTDAILRFNGDGSGSSTSVYTNTSVINNPNAMVELPDGTLLVASDATNNIVRIDTSGNVLNNPFISDGFTQFVQHMIVTEVP